MPDPAQPMIDWINTAPPPELAVEFMVAFGPHGLPDRMSGSETNHGLSNVIDFMFRDYPRQTGIVTRARPVQEALLEAIQLLEHSELVYIRVISDSKRYWSATRLRLTTLAKGNAAVRQRIQDRTGV